MKRIFENIFVFRMFFGIKVSRSLEMIHIRSNYVDEVLVLCFTVNLYYVRYFQQSVARIQIAERYETMSMRTAILRILDGKGKRCCKAHVAFKELVVPTQKSRTRWCIMTAYMVQVAMV